MRAIEALRSARTLLNDDLAITWGDPVLFPKLIQAHTELQLELRINGIDALSNQSARITVPANTLNLYTAGLQPANMISPTTLYEAQVGERVDFFEPMIQMTYLPLVAAANELIYWSWVRQQIMFIGSLTNRDIIIEYVGSITPPVSVNDDLGLIQAELYIGPRVASLARQSIGLDGSEFESLARSNLDKIMKANVLEDQRPVRRRRYRSRKGLLPGTSIARSF